jgi:hypothetical protein
LDRNVPILLQKSPIRGTRRETRIEARPSFCHSLG